MFLSADSEKSCTWKFSEHSSSYLIKASRRTGKTGVRYGVWTESGQQQRNKILAVHVLNIFFSFLASKIIHVKVSFFGQCSKMQLIPIKKFIIKTCFIQFLWFFILKCWFKGQIISRIHLSLPNAYKLMCFDRNINGNMDVKFLIGIIGHCTGQRNLL